MPSVPPKSLPPQPGDAGSRVTDSRHTTRNSHRDCKECEVLAKSVSLKIRTQLTEGNVSCKLSGQKHELSVTQTDAVSVTRWRLDGEVWAHLENSVGGSLEAGHIG